MTQVHQVWRQAAGQLASLGPSHRDIQPEFEAQLLLSHLFNKERSWLFAWSDKELSEDEINRYQALIDRRARGEPIAHITGQKEFWSLPIKVSSATLIPRPETELLVELTLAITAGGQRQILDLGTGTGAIALALASERPGWQITATDRSEQALAIARSNRDRLGLGNIRFQTSHWFNELADHQGFDVILSNPPYIPENDAHLSEGDLPFEPQDALVSGGDGLNDCREIIRKSVQFLKAGGLLLLEHGFDQAHAIQGLFQQAGFSGIQTHQDLAHLDRVTHGRLPG